MSRSPMPQDEQLLERLTLAALEGADRGDMPADEQAWMQELELAAAEAELALGPAIAPYEEIPSTVRQRLEALAEDAETDSSNVVARIDGGDVVYGGRIHPTSTAGGIVPAWVGWVAAAAVVLLAFVLWPAGAPVEPSAIEQRTALIESGAEVLPWGDWDNPEISGIEGDVVWDEATETGYMRFANLPELDNAVYQLWIVDDRGLFAPDGQSARISGGVFTAATGERLENGDLIVPIEAAIDVQNAGLFAVTIEEPGGTWASDMTRRVVVAAKG